MSRRHLTRITYREWAELGGLRNADLCRIQRGRKWQYYAGAK